MTMAQELSYSKKAEMIVLGYAIANPDGLKITCNLLNKEDFYFKQHQSLFAILKEMYQKGYSPDV